MVTRGGGGWIYSDDMEGSAELYFRLDERGRVVELYVRTDGSAITEGDLRHLPLTRVRAEALSRPDLIMMMDQQPAPDVHAAIRSAFPETLIPESLGGPFELSPSSPEGGLTDAFLRDVAAAYRSAVARGLRPNIALAEQTRNYSRRTVERWVYLARKAGHLEPTR